MANGNCYDCCIIGGGVIGLSLAYEISLAGLSVRVIDQGSVGREASWAGAGILPSAVLHPRDHSIEQLAGLSSQLHPELSANLRELTGIDNGYRHCGGIYLAREADHARELDAHMERQRGRGIRAERLASDGMTRVEPALNSRVASAWLLKDEAQVRNPRHLTALRVALEMRGVEISSGVAAREFAIRDDRASELQTSQGGISADSYCVCTGAWSGELLKRWGQSISIVPIRGQIVLFRCEAPPFSRVVNDGPRYLLPRADGRVLAGSTEERAGFCKRNTGEGVAGLLEFAMGLAPALGKAEIEKTWAGLRPGTADGLPYLGKTPGLANVFVAAGHFRAGLHLSTGTARVMGQLVRGEAPEIDLSPFRIDRETPA